MFSGIMVNAWVVALIVAVVAGVVGFFVVLRGATFVAHAVPMSAFAGAAGASLLGVNTIFGLGVFSLGGSLSIGWLGKRGRHDVVTALAVVMMLGLGSLFLSWTTEYAPQIYSLLFGEVLGVSTNEIGLTALLGAVCVLAIALLYRPLLLTSVVPEIAEGRGVRNHRLDMAFLVVVALATTMSVPVVGVLLMFSLMVGPSAAARCFTNQPLRAICLSVLLAITTVGTSIAVSYLSNWPIGFFVGVIGATWFLVGRCWVWYRQGQTRSKPASGTGLVAAP